MADTNNGFIDEKLAEIDRDAKNKSKQGKTIDVTMKCLLVIQALVLKNI